METMNIALPPEMKDFVKEEVAGGGYSSASEYIRNLIRQEQNRKAEARLEALLLEGIESGPMEEMSTKDWDTLRDRLKKRWSKKKRAA